MSASKVKSGIRVFLEALFSALLFGTQTVISFLAFMATPLIFLIPSYLDLQKNFPSEDLIQLNIWMLFSANEYLVGRIVIYVGLAVLLVAATQWIWYHFKGVGLFKKGLYGKVRHPQFLGIITVTMGLTIIVLTEPVTLGNIFFRGTPAVIASWFLQALGYIGIAWFEERRLTKKFGQEYQEYKQKTSFLLPIKNWSKRKDITFTILILLVICFLLLVIPFEPIGRYFGQLFPSPMT